MHLFCLGLILRDFGNLYIHRGTNAITYNHNSAEIVLLLHVLGQKNEVEMLEAYSFPSSLNIHTGNVKSVYLLSKSVMM